jgi:excisionase family DNA binding protein
MEPSEAAEAFGVATNTVARWASKGEIEFTVTVGGHRRYKRQSVLNKLIKLEAEKHVKERQGDREDA